MMLGSVFVLKKVRPRGGMWNFFALLGLCGVSTFVMGGNYRRLLRGLPHPADHGDGDGEPHRAAPPCSPL